MVLAIVAPEGGAAPHAASPDGTRRGDGNPRVRNVPEIVLPPVLLLASRPILVELAEKFNPNISRWTVTPSNSSSYVRDMSAQVRTGGSRQGERWR
jgi:hypothetical protein